MIDLYSEIILDHHKHPHHKGALVNPSISAFENNPLCGDTLTLDLLINESGIISDIGFQGQGCAISQASMSMLSDELIGKSTKEAQVLTNDNIYELLGVPISPARVKCALLSLSTTKKALSLYEHNI